MPDLDTLAANLLALRDVVNKARTDALLALDGLLELPDAPPKAVEQVERALSGLMQASDGLNQARCIAWVVANRAPAEPVPMLAAAE